MAAAYKLTGNEAFAGVTLERSEYIKRWSSLGPDPIDIEVRRNIAIRQPML